jgi:uncharacterized membrane protein
MTRQMLAAAWLLLLLALPGCSGSGLTKIHGTVNLDGKPIANGTIRFEAVDKKTPSAQALIKDGKYEVEVAPGKKNVEIQGYKVVGRKKRNPDDPSAPLEDVTEPIVPPGHTQQTCEIVAGKDAYDFDVSTR